jgi:predicted O-methyltransferase YrrM
MMTEYPNWFKMAAQTNFEKHMVEFKDKPCQALQLGAYTGDASKWMLENILTDPASHLWDVDTWKGSNEVAHHEMDWKDVERTYDEKIAPFAGKVFKEKMTTKEFFVQNRQDFDFIYVDADHTAPGALFDGLFAIDNLKLGGIIAFDDYMWGLDYPVHLRPEAGIDAIMKCYYDRWEILEISWQVWLRRIK